MAVVKQLKYVSDRCKHTVFGYIRGKEEELELNCIPPIITYLCIEFYFQGEYIAKCTNDLKITNDKKTVTKIDRDFAWDNKAYGKIWIDSTSDYIARWTFYIDHFKFGAPTWAHLFIGFVSNEQNTTFCTEVSESPLYLFRANGSHHRIENNDKYKSVNMDETFGTNDRIIITLDTINREINLRINNGFDKCVFADIVRDKNIKYKLVICMFSVGNKVTLTDFECVDYS